MPSRSARPTGTSRPAFAPRVEPTLAGAWRARLTAEDQALWLLFDVGYEPVQAARGACQLLDEDVDARQRFGSRLIGECLYGAAGFFAAGGNPIDRIQAAGEVARRRREIGHQGIRAV